MHSVGAIQSQNVTRKTALESWIEDREQTDHVSMFSYPNPIPNTNF